VGARPHWSPSTAGLVLLAAVAAGLAFVALTIWDGRNDHPNSGRPLPITRQAAGWKYSATRQGVNSARLQWALTYRGEPVPEGGPLITPLGMVNNEPSAIGDTGPILVVSRNARKIPEGADVVTFETLTRGYHPSDCSTKPRGMPPDWSCRPEADEPGWIAPSILFGDRFRVENASP
jgi:hypothetical protein